MCVREREKDRIRAREIIFKIEKERILGVAFKIISSPYVSLFYDILYNST